MARPAADSTPAMDPQGIPPQPQLRIVEEEQETPDPEPRREQQQAAAERRAAEHRQRDTGRHGEDHSRPSSFTRKMH